MNKSEQLNLKGSDPPKMPSCQYMLFLKHNYKKAYDENPGMMASEYSKILSKKWQLLTETEKIPFN